jgi:hypothetical protein
MGECTSLDLPRRCFAGQSMTGTPEACSLDPLPYQASAESSVVEGGILTPVDQLL